jgi:alpha-ribazole phosphatase
MSTLLLVRHGETELKSSERYWGHTDVKLGALGIEQAERVRDLLATERIDIIFSSNLERASKTADIIASRHKVGVITCAELKEVNFGELEGLTFKEIAQRYPEVVKSWVEGKTDLKYPGGESLLMCHLMGIGKENWWRFKLDFASLSVMETNSRGAILRSLNNISHLGGIN